MLPKIESIPGSYELWQSQVSSPWATVSQDEVQWGLAETNRRVIQCSRCPELAQTRTKTVFSSGVPFLASGSPSLCLVGEAPGYYEDQSGEPFVGDAGELLTRILGSIGLSRDKVYICNVLKCRPPQNRKPLPAEVSNCQGYLWTQLSVVRPPVIVCLGSTAAFGVLGLAQSVTSLRGKTFQFQSIPVICTYHPAYLLRHGEAKREVWEDMKRVKLLLMAAAAGSPSGADKS